MSLGGLVEIPDEILFTLNKGVTAFFKKVLCTPENTISPDNGDLAVGFFGGDDPCAGQGFLALAEGSELCVQVPNCEVVGADNCFDSLDECDASVFDPPSFYCVTTGGGSGICCASAIEGGWLCSTEWDPGLATFEACMADDFSASRKAFFPGQDCSYCSTLPVQLNLPPVGEQVPPGGQLIKILVEEYDPSVHTIVSGPISASDSCSSSSSSEGGGGSSSSSSVGSSSSSSGGGGGGSSSSSSGGDGGGGGGGGGSSSSGDGGGGGGGGGSSSSGDGGGGGSSSSSSGGSSSSSSGGSSSSSSGGSCS
jgi:hypothetical protein